MKEQSLEITNPIYKEAYELASKREWESFDRLFYYNQSDLGITYSKTQTQFKIWAPTAEKAEIALYPKGRGGISTRNYQMIPSTNGVFTAIVQGDLEGVYYNYRLYRNNKWQEVVDPYAIAVGVNGNRGMVVDLERLQPLGWESQQRPQLNHFTDAVIYELHIRDLSMHPESGIRQKGKYLGVAETNTMTSDGEITGLDHIKALGVTHVQLLPCFDFVTIDEAKLAQNQFNWGYDPLNYNVPEGSYATDPYDGKVRIKEFQAMVKAIHDNGLGVIMDVVYNHTAQTEHSNFNKIEPKYYYRTRHDGSFSNASACGNEIASERAMVRKYIIDSVTFWARNYKIDGFRFDLMGILDIDTMKAVRKALDEINPSIMLYGEGWTGGEAAYPYERLSLKQNGKALGKIGLFNDDIRDAVKGNVFEKAHAGFINGGVHMEESIKFSVIGGIWHPQINYAYLAYAKFDFASHPEQSINYVSAHDNLTLWDKISAVCPYATEEEKIQMHKLANAIVLLAQGVPFLHAGVEFARTKYGDENSYKSSDEINRLDWNRKRDYKMIYEYYQGLIELRKQHPAFRMYDAQMVREKLSFLHMPCSHMIGYTIGPYANGDAWREIVVIFNSNKESKYIQLRRSTWEVVVNAKEAGCGSLETIKGDWIKVEGRSTLVLYTQE